MSRRIFNSVWIAAVLAVCVSFGAYGQAAGTYTPYSMYGVGDLSQPGSAYNKTMGGVGVALRNNRYLNLTNPAAVTARDSLAFMVDFSLYGDNKIFSQGDIRSVSNTFNINDLAISFPIWRSSAMMVGIMPYGDTGFDYGFTYTDPELVGHAGTVDYSADGSGSIYRAFAAAGVTFFKRLSLGVQWNYYFGNIKKTYYTVFKDSSYNSIMNSTEAQLSGSSFRFGLQYEQSVSSKLTLAAGATYTTAARIDGTMEINRLAGGSVVADTLYHQLTDLRKEADVRLAAELAVGLAFKNPGRWMAEFDYARSDWRDSGLDGTRGFMASRLFSASVAEAYRFGFEIVPNPNDIRYYLNHVAYRFGAYRRNEYYLLDGNRVASTGITLGATFPIATTANNRYNGITVGVDFGQRGSLSGEMVRERYINFSIGFNLFDIWFQKMQYN